MAPALERSYLMEEKSRPCLRKLLFLTGWLWLNVAPAAAPAEVPPDAVFGADKQTLSWSMPIGGADTFNVYRGVLPSSYDQQCRVIGTPASDALLAEIPAPGDLYFFVISAANGDGEGSLAADSNGLILLS